MRIGKQNEKPHQCQEILVGLMTLKLVSTSYVDFDSFLSLNLCNFFLAKDPTNLLPRWILVSRLKSSTIYFKIMLTIPADRFFIPVWNAAHFTHLLNRKWTESFKLRLNSLTKKCMNIIDTSNVSSKLKTWKRRTESTLRWINWFRRLRF